jgi:hypothetical protein
MALTKSRRNAIATLTEARRLLKRSKGWVKNRYFSYNPTPEDPAFFAYCSIGAINKADGPGEEQAIIFLGKAVTKLTGKETMTHQSRVIDFNDSKETKKKDVLAAFDAAIKLASGE